MRKFQGALVAAWLASALPTATAVAQQPQTGSKPKHSDEPQFDRDGDRKSKPTRPAETPEQALERALPIATTWPAEGGENSIRALIARGPEVLPLLKARLKGGTVLERAVAARGLCLLGDKDSFDDIRALLADTRQRPRFPALLASLHELDANRGLELAVTLLEAEASGLRAAGAAVVRGHLTPELLTRLRERLVATPSEAARFDLFVLLEQAKDRELPVVALEKFLGCESHELAARVVEYLSERDDPTLRSELVRLAVNDRERRGLHACLALARAEQRVHAPQLPEELFDAFVPFLRTGDHLLRGVACTVCGMIGYRSEAKGEVTRADVVPALVDTVINGRFFADFELCFKLEVATLELLTGEHLPPSVPAWREWFTKSKGVIPGRRELQSFLLEEDAQNGLVRLEAQDAAGRRTEKLVVVGSAARPLVSDGRKPGWICLDSEAMRALLDGLSADGFLAGNLARSLPDGGAPAWRVTVETRGRERSVTGRADDAAVAAMVTRLRASAEAGYWQLLIASDENHPRRFAEETAWFQTHSDGNARKSRLVDLSLAAIARGDVADTERAFDVLAALDRLGEAVRASQVEGIAALIKTLPVNDSRGRRLFELLIGTGRSDAFQALADALDPRGTAAVPWLAEAIAALKQQEPALADARPLVRVAALDPAAGPRPDAARLVALANGDADERVRVRALERLAEGEDAAAADTLTRLATGGDAPKAVQAAALRLLGRVARDDALATLTRLAREGEPALAAAALEGLSRRGDDAAAAALDAVARERGAADPIGRLALTAMRGLPRGLATTRLVGLMNEAPDDLKREAAYALADLGELAAAPVLFADLEQAKTHQRAQRLLTYLFCQDVGTESWRFRSLYEARPQATHAELFLETLRATLAQSGAATVPEGADLKDRGLAPALVAAIEDPRWFVRRCALEALEAQTGRSLGGLASNATPEEIRELARRWREATANQALGAGQR